MALPTAPTSEQGRVSDTAGMGVGLMPWGVFTDEGEYVPELQWPNSVQVYDRMGADAQISGLVRSVVLPLQRRAWCLDPNGADPASVERLADELDLPILGQERGVRRRRRGRFSFYKHLTDALRALTYGHYIFEQTGTVENNEWILNKLAPRPPRTIQEINVAPDGGLVSIKQALGINSTELSVDRLVAYVWDQEAGNWAGRSMLRPLYKNWLVKDRLLRVDAIKHERGAIGAPIIEAPPGASPAQVEELAAMAQAMKITSQGGGAIPSGAKLAGMAGPSSSDTIGSVRFHNEEMAGAFLAMFKQLGQTQTGSRALGDTFMDFFSLALDAVADWIMDTFDAHVIEDWYDWNYGEDSQAAVLAIEEEPEPAADIAPLQEEIAQGDVEVSPETAEDVQVPAQASPRSSTRRRQRREPRGSSAAVSVESPSVPLPPRALRRDPYPQEIQATTDYKVIDETLNKEIDKAVKEISGKQGKQIEELHDKIVAAKGDLRKIAALEVAPIGESAILGSMQRTAEMGIKTASDEAARQGVENVLKGKMSELDDRIAARAVATDQLLASGLADAAKRQVLRLTGEGTPAASVAGQVSTYLKGLSDTYLRDQMNGALTQAMNDGRRATMRRNAPTSIYSSELLDEATCDECAAIDGEQYSSVDESTADYPTGGYADCLGMERCRGTLVAVYSESEGTPQ